MPGGRRDPRTPPAPHPSHHCAAPRGRQSRDPSLRPRAGKLSARPRPRVPGGSELSEPTDPPRRPPAAVPVFCRDSRPFCCGVRSGCPSGGRVASVPAAAAARARSSSRARAGSSPRSPAHMVALCPPPPPRRLLVLLLPRGLPLLPPHPGPARCSPRPRVPHVPGAARRGVSAAAPEGASNIPAEPRWHSHEGAEQVSLRVAANGSRRPLRPPAGGRPCPGGRLQPPASPGPPPRAAEPGWAAGGDGAGRWGWGREGRFRCPAALGSRCMTWLKK